MEAKDVNNIAIRNNHITYNQKRNLNQLIKNCSNFFADPNEKLTYNTNVAAEIKTITDSPVYSNYTNYPTSMKDEVEKQVKQLLDDGIIRPSRSPYCSPV